MPNSADLRAVIVDVDGTLYDLAAVRRWTALRLAGFTITEPALGWKTLRALRAFRNAQERLRQAGGESGARDQLSWAAKSSGCKADFIHACVTRWMEEEPLPAVRRARFEGVTEFFHWAAERELPIAVVSDYDPRKKLRALGLDSQVQ